MQISRWDGIITHSSCVACSVGIWDPRRDVTWLLGQAQAEDSPPQHHSTPPGPEKWGPFGECGPKPCI